jgi:hypothetical protein
LKIARLVTWKKYGGWMLSDFTDQNPLADYSKSQQNLRVTEENH